jgi:uncharacterized membrane-anchored protein YhcB (DUF1043 family)
MLFANEAGVSEPTAILIAACISAVLTLLGMVGAILAWWDARHANRTQGQEILHLRAVLDSREKATVEIFQQWKYLVKVSRVETEQIQAHLAKTHERLAAAYERIAVLEDGRRQQGDKV